MTLWGVLWRSDSLLDGETEHLMYGGLLPLIFTTRAAARAYIADNHGYLRTYTALQKEPHGWKMPKPVRVKVILA